MSLNPHASALVYDVRFPLGRSMIISGPSCSGKSYFVTQLMKHNQLYFTPTPKRIFWYYGEVKTKTSLVNICYKKGTPSDRDVESFH